MPKAEREEGDPDLTDLFDRFATDTYLGRPRLDDMVAAVRDATYGMGTDVLGVAQMAHTALEATTGIEPVYTALQAAA